MDPKRIYKHPLDPKRIYKHQVPPIWCGGPPRVRCSPCVGLWNASHSEDCVGSLFRRGQLDSHVSINITVETLGPPDSPTCAVNLHPLLTRKESEPQPRKKRGNVGLQAKNHNDRRSKIINLTGPCRGLRRRAHPTTMDSPWPDLRRAVRVVPRHVSTRIALSCDTDWWCGPSGDHVKRYLRGFPGPPPRRVSGAKSHETFDSNTVPIDP